MFGLVFAVFVGSLNALFMTPRTEWFSSLSGVYVNGHLHAVVWLFMYLLQAVTVGEFVYKRGLNKHIWIPILSILSGAAWCFLFFRANLLIPSFILITLMTALCFVTLVLLSRTKVCCYLYVFFCAWQTYLWAICLYLVILN